jgi:hypothetical protein
MHKLPFELVEMVAEAIKSRNKGSIRPGETLIAFLTAYKLSKNFQTLPRILELTKFGFKPYQIWPALFLPYKLTTRGTCAELVSTISQHYNHIYFSPEHLEFISLCNLSLRPRIVLNARHFSPIEDFLKHRQPKSQSPPWARDSCRLPEARQNCS